ncbi:MAG: hypothetical protein K6L76_04555 [Agarilytica sp.]
MKTSNASLKGGYTAYGIDNTVIEPLSEYRLLLVEGVDCEKFLQGQLSCDISKLGRLHFQMGAHCTPKGRMISSFLAAPFLATENAIALRVHESIATTALEALKKYAVFSKVQLTLREDIAIAALISNTPNASWAEKHGTTFLNTSTQSIFHDANRVEVWLPFEALPSFISEQKDTVIKPTSNLWQLTNIRAGYGEVRAELAEELLPQEMNFQFTDGISFKKGCYTGQEIVARLHYRGALKKHMYRGSIESDIAPSLGDSIYLSKDNDKVCGRLLRIAQASETQWEFLALAEDNALQSECVFKQEDSRTKIQWLSLPYAIS